MNRPVACALVALFAGAGAWLAWNADGPRAAAEESKSASAAKPLQFKLQSRTKNQAGDWEVQTVEREFAPAETAILICDMWDKHWCASATRRCGELAEKMAPLIEAARARGVTIVHAPSDTMDFYKDSPQRKRILAAATATPKVPIDRWYKLDKQREADLPIDDTDGGCDDEPQCRNYKAWTREHPAIRVADEDVVSENGVEVYNYLVERGIKNILYVGVHTNMCVLGRSFGIRQMSREGFQTVLVRDLTDTMYNPRQRPFVEHRRGTELVIEHVEKYWCPTTTSADLARELK